MTANPDQVNKLADAYNVHVHVTALCPVVAELVSYCPAGHTQVCAETIAPGSAQARQSEAVQLVQPSPQAETDTRPERRQICGKIDNRESERVCVCVCVCA